jgi:hypothetical protein
MKTKEANGEANEPRPKLELGPDGNAFAILGRATCAMRKAGCSKSHIERMMDEATSGDYDHLLLTVGKYCEVR